MKSVANNGLNCLIINYLETEAQNICADPEGDEDAKR